MDVSCLNAAKPDYVVNDPLEIAENGKAAGDQDAQPAACLTNAWDMATNDAAHGSVMTKR